MTADKFMWRIVLPLQTMLLMVGEKSERPPSFLGLQPWLLLNVLFQLILAIGTGLGGAAYVWIKHHFAKKLSEQNSAAPSMH